MPIKKGPQITYDDRALPQHRTTASPKKLKLTAAARSSQTKAEFRNDVPVGGLVPASDETGTYTPPPQDDIPPRMASERADLDQNGETISADDTLAMNEWHSEMDSTPVVRLSGVTGWGSGDQDEQGHISL